MRSKQCSRPFQASFEDGLWRLPEMTALFEALAPFVASGNIIRVCEEDREEWRWEFDGQSVQIIEEKESSYER